MKNSRNQLILLGFVCQGLAWEGYYLLLLNVLLWLGCLVLPRKPVRLSPLTECGLLWGGSALTLWLGSRLGQSSHFFIGEGLTLMQAARLMRPLDRREKIFSLLMACFQLAVGCTFIFDYRFIPILIAAILLVPKSLLELETEPFLSRPPLRPQPPTFTAYAVIVAVMIVFFVTFPRGLLGSPLQYNPPRLSEEGTLLDSVLDPARSGVAQSDRVLLQIDGEQLGYLRCLALRDFNGRTWRAENMPGLHSFAPVPPAGVDRLKLRRVRVKDVAFLGHVLPTDGRVAAVDGRFFRRPLLNTYGIVECESLWNTGNNAYEYRVDPKPRLERLSPAFAARYLNYPPQSARLRAWLDDVLAGTTSPILQARRLESYLRDHFQYKLGAPELNRLQPIDDFIFNWKQGHCERFAASLALLLRMKEIPSRIVIGYVPTSRNRFTGWYNIRFKDAHAWTEAYFKETGWIPLDATPPAPEEITGWNLGDLLETLDVLWYSNIINFDAGTQKYLVNLSLQSLNRLPAWFHDRQLWLWEGLAAVLLIVAAHRYSARRRQSRTAGPARAKAVVLAEHYYGQMLRALDRLGNRRAPAQTPFEFLRELEQRSLPMRHEARLITETFCATRYGHSVMDSLREAQVEQALQRIRSFAQVSARTR